MEMNVAQNYTKQLYTPLRYPGGKTSLFRFFEAVMSGIYDELGVGRIFSKFYGFFVQLLGLFPRSASRHVAVVLASKNHCLE